MQPVISVIIPVYNTAPWLRRCLESVCGQALQNIEIICVNDGSTDGSAEILDEYVQQDRRILPISLARNQGVSVARNIGMEAATGEWLGFVDSDDTILPDFYEKLYAAATSSHAEIVKGVRWSERLAPTYIDRSINKRIKENKQNFCIEWTTAIYNTDFIRMNNIRFIPECIRHEDVAFAYIASTSAKKIKIVDNAVYKYSFRPGSANTQLCTYRQVMSILSAYASMLAAIDKHIENSDTYVNEYYTHISSITYIPPMASAHEKSLVCRDVASSVIEFFANCRERDKLFQKFSLSEPALAIALREKNELDVANYVSLSRIDRLRNRIKKQLTK